MKNFLTTIWTKIFTFRPIQNFMADMSSLRAIWCWLFLGLFFSSYIYMIRVNHAVHGTALTILGGMVSWIFSNYVVSGVIDRHIDKFTAPKVPPTAPVEKFEPQADPEDEQGA